MRPRLIAAGLILLTAASLAAEPIPVESVLIRLIEQVDVPAQEEGVLAQIEVQEGEQVTPGQVLGMIDATQAKINVQRARLEVEIARRKSTNDVAVRFSKKATEVAKAELARSTESVEKYRKSISQSEIDRLKLTVDKSTLEIEQAKHELDVEAVTRQLKEAELQAAEHVVERCKFISPIRGVVVEINSRPGEWVKPGQKVLRVLQLDKLRAEGFVRAKDLTHDLAGAGVSLTVDLPGRPATAFSGKVVFVSPEIDPVNGQVRIWAEIDNANLQLRPGMRAKMQVQ